MAVGIDLTTVILSGAFALVTTGVVTPLMVWLLRRGEVEADNAVDWTESFAKTWTRMNELERKLNECVVAKAEMESDLQRRDRRILELELETLRLQQEIEGLRATFRAGCEALNNG